MSATLEERRSAPLIDVELRDDEAGDGLTFSGYAAVYDEEADIGWFKERIAKGAFKKTLKDKADVRFLVNHDGVPLARTKSGTLTLEEDDHGLKVNAHLDPANPRVAELRSAMSRRDLDQMSFAFSVVKETIENEGEDDELRVLQEVRLYDVSAVTYPAYEGTSAEMRSQKVDLVRRYAASLGVAVPDWPEVETPAEEERAEPQTEPLTEHSEHSLDLDGARINLALRQRRRTALSV